MSVRRPPRLTKINKFEQIWIDLLWKGGLDDFTTLQAREYLLLQKNHYGRKYRRVPANPRLDSILRKSPYFDRQLMGPWLRTRGKGGEEE